MREGHARYSRHWYDLYMLAEKGIADQACSDIQLLRDVIEIEQCFFVSKYSNFEECLKGNFSLVPSGIVLEGLRNDYNAMLKSNMIYGEIPQFDQIIKSMKAIQDKINTAIQVHIESEVTNFSPSI